MSLTHEIYMKHYGNKDMVKKKPEANRTFDEKTNTFFYHSCPRCGKEINGTTADLEKHIFSDSECVMKFKIVERVKSKIPWWKVKGETEYVAPRDSPKPTPKTVKKSPGVETKEELDKIIDEAFE